MVQSLTIMRLMMGSSLQSHDIHWWSCATLMNRDGQRETMHNRESFPSDEEKILLWPQRKNTPLITYIEGELWRSSNVYTLMCMYIGKMIKGSCYAFFRVVRWHDVKYGRQWHANYLSRHICIFICINTVWPKENWSKVNDYNIKSNWCKTLKQKTHKSIYSQVVFIFYLLFML